MSDTWKFVPVEPTEQMIEAGRHVKRMRLLDSVKAIREGRDPEELMGKTAGAEYRAMLAAAPAPPVPASVQDIMRLMNPYVRTCVKVAMSFPAGGIDGAEAATTEAFKPLQAALTALVDDNHRLKFELDGVRAMRGPLTEAEVTAIHSLPYVRACLMEYRHWPVDETASAVVKAIAVQISALAASPYTNGIEPEQGGKP